MCNNNWFNALSWWWKGVYGAYANFLFYPKTFIGYWKPRVLEALCLVFLLPGGMAGQDRPALRLDQAHPCWLWGEVWPHIPILLGCQWENLRGVLWDHPARVVPHHGQAGSGDWRQALAVCYPEDHQLWNPHLQAVPWQHLARGAGERWLQGVHKCFDTVRFLCVTSLL